MRCVVVCDPAQMGATARAVTAARTIPGLQALALLAPEGLYRAADAPCDVLAAAAPCFATPEAAAALVGAVCAPSTPASARVTHILAPATLFGRAVLPRAAAAVCAPCVTDVVRFDGAQRLQRHTAAGRLLETISVTAPFVFLLFVCSCTLICTSTCGVFCVSQHGVCGRQFGALCTALRTSRRCSAACSASVRV